MDFVTVSTGLILPYWMGLPIRYIQKGCTYKFKRALEIHPDVQNAIDALIQLYGTKKEE